MTPAPLSPWLQSRTDSRRGTHALHRQREAYARPLLVWTSALSTQSPPYVSDDIQAEEGQGEEELAHTQPRLFTSPGISEAVWEL